MSNKIDLLLLRSILGSFAEEDIGRQGIATPMAGNATASRGLEVAVANLQEYCNGMSPLSLLGSFYDKS